VKKPTLAATLVGQGRLDLVLRYATGAWRDLRRAIAHWFDLVERRSG
jgi:hypothetical protein